MIDDDLLAMFGLDDEPEEVPAPSGWEEVEGGEASKDPASPTALDLDEWGRRRGTDLLKDVRDLRDLQTSVDEAADFFGAAFEPDPHLLPKCEDRQRREYLQQLMETPEYKALHDSTQLDETASQLAATHFAIEWAKLKDKREKRKDKTPDPARDEMEALKAAARALRKAEEDVEEMKEAEAMVGFGHGDPRPDPQRMDPKRLAELFRRVRNHPTLKRICELAGKFRRMAKAKQRAKTSHGQDDVVGVTTGNDLGRLLPSELVQLGDPDFELDAMRRFAERQLMQRDYRGVEKLAKGPVIVTVDESGSMQGEKANSAKALALALAWIARRQNRWCCLVAYSGDSGERVLPLPPGRWCEEELMLWMIGWIGGGSALDVPVRELPRIYEQIKAPKGKTDVVMVTDALIQYPGVQQIAATFAAWKVQAKAHVTAIVINNDPGNEQYTRQIKMFADDTQFVPLIDTEQPVVGQVLSI